MKKWQFFLLGMCLSAAELSAQSVAVYDKTRHEFGSILWKTPAMATFEVKNKGNKPLVIKKIHPSCDCTVVDWKKEPIAPGESAKIIATYDANILGHFERYLQVYSNATEEPFYLTLTGDVVTEVKTFTGDYPLKVGDLYVSTDNLEFDDVNRGEQIQQTLTVVNTGKQTCMPGLMHLPKYLSVIAVPETLRGGATGKLVVTLDSRQLHDMGLTQTSVYVSRNPGDKVSHDNEISVSAVLLPAFDNMTPAQMAAAPVLDISTTELELDMNGKKSVSGTILLTNKGQSTLTVRSLQVFNPALNVSLSKRHLAPGKTGKLKLKVQRDYLKRSKSRLRVLLTTNDPKMSKVFINVKLTP